MLPRVRYSHRVVLFLSFAAIYLIWGSTYLVIRCAVDTLPPLLMSGVRSLTAGAILFGLSSRGRLGTLRAAHGYSAVVTGGFLFLGGQGLLAWAEQRVYSGIAALVLATIPIWMVILDGLLRRRGPRRKTVLGAGLGFVGVFVLVLGRRPMNAALGEPVTFAALLASAFLWASGSLYARRAPLPEHVPLSTALQLLSGGALLILAGAATGELSRLDLSQVSIRSGLCVLYLIVFGSIVAFSAYSWLLRIAEPALVGTYAFVNPVVAVLLGWTLGGEALHSAAALAGGLIVVGVVLIHLSENPRSPGV